FEHAAESFDVDPRLVAPRIQLFGARDEQDVDAGVLRDACVALLIARVAGEVLVRSELGGIDEDARDDGVAFTTRRLQQRDVPRVQRAHRRDEADDAVAADAAQLHDRAHGLHAFVTSASTRYIGSSSGASSWIARTCESTVSQSPRAIGPVSSKPFSIVRVISGTSASGGAPAASRSGDPARCSVTR